MQLSFAPKKGEQQRCEKISHKGTKRKIEEEKGELKRIVSIVMLYHNDVLGWE